MNSMAELWCIMVIMAVLQNLISPLLLSIVRRWWESWESRWRAYKFFRIPQYYGSDGLQENGLYNKIDAYVSTLGGAVDTHNANLYSGKNSNDIYVALDEGESVEDIFLGARVWWMHEVRERGEVHAAKSFVLKIHKKDRVGILKPYLEHVQAVAEDVEHRKRELKLYTNSENLGREKWVSVTFKHPATFDTIALESDLRNRIKSDLETFAKGKHYYHRLGRAWKRGYLLYGPAGTGKSSMIAAMANFLRYDIYDLELTKVKGNSELRMLLMHTRNKSILVIEDIDCSLDLSRHGGSDEDQRQKRRYDENEHESSRVTLSGMLNFIDGLWSCCGEERIIVFTTNNKDKLDPALLRPGRMDMHISFSHCTFPAFKILASNYLGVKEHKLFPHVEESFRAGACMTPAEIGEILLVNKNSPSRALKTLINALQSSAKSGNVERGNGVVVERAMENGFHKESERSSGWDMMLRKGSQRLGSEDTTTKGALEQLQDDSRLTNSGKNTSFADLKKLQNLFKTKHKSKCLLVGSDIQRMTNLKMMNLFENFDYWLVEENKVEGEELTLHVLKSIEVNGILHFSSVISNDSASENTLQQTQLEM